VDYRGIIKKYLLNKVIHDMQDLEDDQQLIDSGLIDSISIVKVIIFFENEFGISFEEKDMSPLNFDTVQAMVETVKRKMEE
jgi:methoxymalonate biosynthesis acyl carrier protein